MLPVWPHLCVLVVEPTLIRPSRCHCMACSATIAWPALAVFAALACHPPDPPMHTGTCLASSIFGCEPCIHVGKLAITAEAPQTPSQHTFDTHQASTSHARTNARLRLLPGPARTELPEEPAAERVDHVPTVRDRHVLRPSIINARLMLMPVLSLQRCVLLCFLFLFLCPLPALGKHRGACGARPVVARANSMPSKSSPK
jgi:hypothetical protein